MFIYSYQVKLEYEYIEQESYSRNITYIYENMEYKDKDTGIHICLKEGFEINVSEVVAANRDNAFMIACGVIQKVCKVLTILLQIQNYDNRESCPNLTFLPYKVKMLSEEKVIKSAIEERSGNVTLREYSVLHDCIAGISITQELNLSLFEKFYCGLNNMSFIDASDVIYRAVLAQNAESRFFQLFTIIEAIETKYGSDEDISHKMIEGDKVEMAEKIIQNLLERLMIKDGYRKSLNSRLMQIIKTATIESRAEKLTNIIIKKCNVLEVKKGLIKYSIDSKKMKEFIDVRNKLFHGNHVKKEEYNILVQRTNELQELCLLLLGYT